jgi:hypothetical protein
MNFPIEISPLDILCRTLAPDDLIDWHRQEHDELCLVLEGKPGIGHAGGKHVPPPDTLFVFKKGEMHGFWNSRQAIARLWLLEFRISSVLRTQNSESSSFPRLNGNDSAATARNWHLRETRPMCLIRSRPPHD